MTDTPLGAQPGASPGPMTERRRGREEGGLVLGVLGTLPWDTVHDRDPARAPVEEWGGIAYALGAFEAALEESWQILPILKVGRDLASRAHAFLGSLPRVRLDGVRVVPEANNRVELRYQDSERRTERLTGGVPGWTEPELEPVLGRVDALYVNFISGFEVDLATARWLRTAFDGPIYADLHSLFLGVTRRGERFGQELVDASEWLQSFDAVQMNETEFDLLGRAAGDPWGLAAASVGDRLKLISVTLGPLGAAYVVSPDFRPDPMTWRKSRHVETARPVPSGRVVRPVGSIGTDPTGCGDVWGATCYARLLAGDDLETAMARANAVAGRNAHLRGADSLHRHLRGQLSAGGGAR